MKEKEFQQYVRFLEYYTTPEGTPEFKRIQAIASLIAQKIYAEISNLEQSRRDLIYQSEQSQLNQSNEILRLHTEIIWWEQYLIEIQKAEITLKTSFKKHQINKKTLDSIASLSPELLAKLPPLQVNKIKLPYYSISFMNADGKTEFCSGDYAKIFYHPNEDIENILATAKKSCEIKRNQKITYANLQIEKLKAQIEIIRTVLPKAPPYQESLKQISTDIETKKTEIQAILKIPQNKWEMFEYILQNETNSQ